MTDKARELVAGIQGLSERLVATGKYSVVDVALLAEAAIFIEQHCPEGGEPVAWRVKDFADGWILFSYETPARQEARRAGALMQPLYLRPDDRVRKLREALADARNTLNEIANNGWKITDCRKFARQSLKTTATALADTKGE